MFTSANLVTEYYIEPNISIVNDTLRERLPKGEIAMVVMTSTQYLANVYELAPMFPKVAFVQYGTALSGPPRKNVQSYSLRTMRIRYLQGYLCGLATKTGKVGWVSRAPGVPSAITQNMNYFYIGMKEANPQAELLIGYTAIDVQAVIAGRYVASKLVNDHQVDCLAHQNIDHTPLLGANNDTVLMGWQTDERYLLGEQVWASVDVSFTEHIDVILNTLVLNCMFLYLEVTDPSHLCRHVQRLRPSQLFGCGLLVFPLHQHALGSETRRFAQEPGNNRIYRRRLRVVFGSTVLRCRPWSSFTYVDSLFFNHFP